jgi:hypothetical protein
MDIHYNRSYAPEEKINVLCLGVRYDYLRQFRGIVGTADRFYCHAINGQDADQDLFKNSHIIVSECPTCNLRGNILYKQNREAIEKQGTPTLAIIDSNCPGKPEIFEWGFTDYLTTPFVAGEVLARLKAYADVVDWFKRHAEGGKGCQTDINRALRNMWRGGRGGEISNVST